MARTRRVSRRASKVSRRSKASRKSSRRSKASRKSSRRSKKAKLSVHEYDTTDELPMKMLRKKVQKKSKFVKRKRSSKRKKGPSPYNKFVKSKFAVYKKEQPGLKAPEIMKKIAKEWKSRSVNAPQPEK